MESKEAITEYLEQLEEELDIRILFAVESGSRAWGFESSDSDYDVRFVYAHKLDWYLSIHMHRDTIQRDVFLDGGRYDVDAVGWELRKALRLFSKSNPAIIEWLHSPTVYYQRDSLFDELKLLAKQNFSMKALAWHYWHMASNIYTKYIASQTFVSFKKYLYVLRPLFNLYWLENHHTIPPINFEHALMVLMHPDIYDIVHTLLGKKKAAIESDKGPSIAMLNNFILEEISRLEKFCQGCESRNMDLDQLNQLCKSNVLFSL